MQNCGVGFFFLYVSMNIYIFVCVGKFMFITSVFVYVFMGFIFLCICWGIVFTNKHVWVFIVCAVFNYIGSHVHIEK